MSAHSQPTSQPTRLVRTSLALLVALAAALGLQSCYQFQPAPNTPDLDQVVNAVESVLKERFYQTKVLRTSGLGFSVAADELEGNYPVRHKIDVYIEPMRTGHYMPRVSVRKYMDLSEPAIESGADFTDYSVQGNPWTKARWTAIHFDRSMEQEIRAAILEKLNIPA